MAKRFAKPYRGRPRHVSGQPNQTELAYQDLLDIERKLGNIRSYSFEGIKLNLAQRTSYTPDFHVVTKDCIELHEVKGFWEDDARVKIKVAAQMFPCYKFIAVTLKKCAGGYEIIKREEF